MVAEVVGPVLIEAAEVMAVVLVAVMAMVMTVMVTMVMTVVVAVVAVMADPPVVVGTVEELATLLADPDDSPDLDVENERLVMLVGADAVASTMDDIAEGNVAAGVAVVAVVAVTTVRAEAVVVIEAVLAVGKEDLDLLEDELLALLMAREVEDEVLLRKVEVYATPRVTGVAVVAAPAEVPMTATVVTRAGEMNGAVVWEELAAVVPVAATELSTAVALVEAVVAMVVTMVDAVMVAVVVAVVVTMVSMVMSVVVSIMMSVVSKRLNGSRVQRRQGSGHEGGDEAEAHGCRLWSSRKGYNDRSL